MLKNINTSEPESLGVHSLGSRRLLSGALFAAMLLLSSQGLFAGWDFVQDANNAAQESGPAGTTYSWNVPVGDTHTFQASASNFTSAPSPPVLIESGSNRVANWQVNDENVTGNPYGPAADHYNINTKNNKVFYELADGQTVAANDTLILNFDLNYSLTSGGQLGFRDWNDTLKAGTELWFEILDAVGPTPDVQGNVSDNKLHSAGTFDNQAFGGGTGSNWIHVVMDQDASGQPEIKLKTVGSDTYAYSGVNVYIKTATTLNGWDSVNDLNGSLEHTSSPAFRITFDGSGADTILTAVPEPSTVLPIAALLGGLVLFTRHRHKRR